MRGLQKGGLMLKRWKVQVTKVVTATFYIRAKDQEAADVRAHQATWMYGSGREVMNTLNVDSVVEVAVVPTEGLLR
jgi:hypothetical protein